MKYLCVTVAVGFLMILAYWKMTFNDHNSFGAATQGQNDIRRHDRHTSAVPLVDLSGHGPGHTLTNVENRYGPTNNDPLRNNVSFKKKLS